MDLPESEGLMTIMVTMDLVCAMGGICSNLQANLTHFQCALGYQPLMFPSNRSVTKSPAVDKWLLGTMSYHN